MSSSLQLVSFLFSFLFGVVFSFLTSVNNYVLQDKSKIVKCFITGVFVLDIVLLYVYMMYKINMGILHIYFIMVLVLGYIGAVKCQTCVKRKIKLFKKTK